MDADNAVPEPPPPPLPQPLSLRGRRLIEPDLGGVVMRAAELDGADLDSAWLADGGTLLVNGVDVVGYVNAELDRRFPGREGRHATTVAGLRGSWDAVRSAWAATVDRALALGAVDRRVDDEWSTAETLRHLVMATDTWLGKAVLRREQPYHPIGLANPEAADDGLDPATFSLADPHWEQVLEARSDRQDQVTAFLEQIADDQLAEERSNPWAPQYPETIRSCLGTILTEEWEHLRFVHRDLDTIAAG